MFTYFPKYFTNKAILLYFILLALNMALFSNYALHWTWVVFGIVEVVGFFYMSNTLSRKWSVLSQRSFTRSLVSTALLLRVAYVIFSYFYYIHMTGEPFEFDAADAHGYHLTALDMLAQLKQGNPRFWDIGYGISDTGYATYLSIVYLIFGESIIVARLLKAVWGTLTVWLMYRLATRNFGEHVGRLTGILCMLMPNLIYYCGLHLKEVEMLFLIVLFVERGDNLLRQSTFMFWPTFMLVINGLALFTFRTVLGAVAFIAFFMALVLSSSRIVSWGRRILVGLIAIAFVGIMFSNRIEEELHELTETNIIETQQRNMQWRSTRRVENGATNPLIKYAGAAVFAPMIFTIPFPTLIEVSGHENQKLLHGGNFDKNITSFFTILAMLLLLKPYNWRRSLFEGEWRKHILPVAVLGGYLIILVFSSFAHSERFHQPSVPFAMMFAAYTICNFKPKWKNLYTIWLLIIFTACMAWSMFKVIGFGM